ncbi:MAG TPA: B12-binding domain-containing protein [Dehalococcoidia bacterium]|nr:B12-binding domain-containing protein [Dehalococcoidia bacterium]
MAGDEFEPIGRVVQRLQQEFPDVTISSLRFLEREGLLTPSRTAGGHRLYTWRDYERIRQIKRWQAQRLSLTEIRERLAAGEQLPDWSDLAAMYGRALIDGDPERAADAIRRAHDAGASLIDLAEQVLQPALYEIGRLWECGDVSVAQEHQATAVTRDLLAQLAAAADHYPPKGQRAIAACAEGERHDLGLKMVATGLELAGWRVDYLGADVPTETLLSLVEGRRPDLIILSVTGDEFLPAANCVAQAVRDLTPDRRPRLQIGGQAVERRPDPTLWLTEDLDGGLSETVARLAPPAFAGAPA